MKNAPEEFLIFYSLNVLFKAVKQDEGKGWFPLWLVPQFISDLKTASIITKSSLSK